MNSPNQSDNPDSDNEASTSKTTTAAGDSSPLRPAIIGSLYMVGAAISFTGLDTVMKFLAGSYDFWFLAWARSLAQFAFIMAIVPFLSFQNVLPVQRPGIQFVRGVCLAAATLAILLSLREMALTQTYVALMTTPLVSVALSPLVLGERATWGQWFWILLGFAGTVIALNPAAPEIGSFLLYAAMMAISLGTYHVYTRLGSRTESNYTQLFYVLVIALVLTTPLLLIAEGGLPLEGWLLIFLAGAFGTAAHFFITFSFSYATPAVVAPMWYTQIIWAAIAGYIVFNEIPTIGIIVGSIIVVISGLATVRTNSH